MSQKYIITIDQGTTGSRVFLINKEGETIGFAYEEFTQYYPKPGWVEHDANEIWSSITKLISQVLKKTNVDPQDALGIGITNQRETTVIFDKETGIPVHNAIVWQCRRTSKFCDELKANDYTTIISKKTGLVIDAYFSGTKINWLLNNVAGLKEKARNGDVLFGTIDTFLLYKLTGQVSHKTDYTNASRTLIYNIYEKRWDDEILKILDIPKAILPQVQKSSSHFGETKGLDCLPNGIPIYSMIGDQQAALFGQNCYHKGDIKNTYGTGCFLLMNMGDKPVKSKNGLLTTLACDADGSPVYALEGSVFIAGAVVQYLRDSLKLFESAAESETLARNANQEDDVVFVPAFAGLGAPYWDQDARGAIFGLTRDTSIEQIARAALKSIALQSLELIESMEKDSGIEINELKVDGGATQNNYLMEYQASILNKQVIRPRYVDTTVLGAAYLAGLAAGLWQDASQLVGLNPPQMVFKTDFLTQEQRIREIEKWKQAVNRVLTK